MTAYGSIDSAVQAMKMGACDYITKSGDIGELVFTVKKPWKQGSCAKRLWVYERS